MELWLALPIALIMLIDGWFNVNQQPDLIQRLARKLDPSAPDRYRRPLGLALMLLATAFFGAWIL